MNKSDILLGENMDYIPGYRCPICGDKLKRTTLGILCNDMGHWAGTLDEADRVDDRQFEFERFFSENELRFAHAMFDDIDIGFSSFLAGMDYQKKLSQ